MRRSLIAILCIVLAACAPTEPADPTAAPVVLPNRIIAFWQSVSDTLATPAETHGWQFYGKTNDAIRLYLTDPAANAVFILEDPQGDALIRANDTRLFIPADGIYTIRVQHTITQDEAFESQPYTLKLEYTDRPDPSQPTLTPTITRTPTPTFTPTPLHQSLGLFVATLNHGDAREGTFSRAGERHVYIFSADAHTFATISLENTSGTADPFLTLYDPNGQAIAVDDNTGDDKNALIRNIRLPQTGEYSIQASGNGLSGTYRISLRLGETREAATPNIPQPTITVTPSETPAPRADRLVDHVPVAGQLTQPGEILRYPIEVNAGDIITIGVIPLQPATLRPRAELYNPQGEHLYTASASTSGAGGDALIPAFAIPTTGRYLVIVSGEAQTIGLFNISYGIGFSHENILRGNAAVDTPNNGEIIRRGYRDLWTIWLTEGDVISASASPLDPYFDPVLDIIAPDGTQIARDNNTGGGRSALISNLRAPQTGHYALRVTGDQATTSGIYSLVWHYLSAAPTPTPAAVSIRIMTIQDIAPEQTYRFYPFQGQAGQRIRVYVAAPTGNTFDPVAALLTNNGEVLIDVDDNGDDLNPLFEYTLPADDTYYIRVNGYGDSTGGFTLTVDALY